MAHSIHINIDEARLGRSVVRTCMLVLSVTVGLWLSAQTAIAQKATPSETQVKAAFILNFPKYVEWPVSSFPATNSPIVIAVVGEEKVFAELQKMVEGRTVNSRPITFKYISSDTNFADCHILFVSSAEQHHLPNLVARLKDASVLTVGESDGFLEDGGIINLARRDRKIALEVNLVAASKARLKISSRLLSVAQVVQGKQN